ncbi:hypothetical protein Halru_2191 [Halovivax ruber XH-70]|uniref:DNA primase DnaG n=1 Tax=Halovivax ruber (strain DSM 18193 / JCM 13892 / XH-70) TaxID=797302 RepID=L0ID84_HALRX|nr:DNA primase DnaG [Halovivax ruber]AGB16778.1 hypothetical protein Halru_2191 [Halovivax ruber XH-70]
MDETEKYLIHAAVTAAGVVERSDVVGAIFGQTEGLLGDELDLPELRRTGKLGHIDVSVSSSGGESRGAVTISTSLDKVETATLAASLETIDRVGPCRAAFEVEEIEDVRAAKRREVVDRAAELLQTGFDDSVMSSAEILSSVREHVRVADIDTYEGLPAGPRVTESDAIIVVEGRADVLTLLRYGIKNAVGVEGTDVPDEIASLTRDRTTTAFFDADRGGELILEELRQVGDVDYVARPPDGTSVEDLDHHEVFTALRKKEPIEPDVAADVVHAVQAGEQFDPETSEPQDDPSRAPSSTDGGASTRDPPAADPSPVDHQDSTEEMASPGRASTTGETGARTARSSSPSAIDTNERAANSDDDTATSSTESTTADTATSSAEPATADTATSSVEPATAGADTTDTQDTSTSSGAESVDPTDETTVDEPAVDTDESPHSLYEHVAELSTGESGTARFLDEDRTIIGDYPVNEVSDRLETDAVPSVILLDGVLSQELVDRAATSGVSTIIATSLGQFVKRPTSVRIFAADSVASEPPAE